MTLPLFPGVFGVDTVPAVVAATGVDVLDIACEPDNTKWPNIGNGVEGFPDNLRVRLIRYQP